jgi:hypothetical protein
MLPWAHGHQRKGIGDFVTAIIAQQSGCQAQLARAFGHQEAATKRLACLLHNERLEPRHLADAVLGSLPLWAQMCQPCPEQAIGWPKPRTMNNLGVDGELMPRRQVFQAQ